MIPSDTTKAQRTFPIQLRLETDTLSDLRVAVANALDQPAAKTANMRFVTASGLDVTQHETLAHSIQPNSVITIIARARGGTKESQRSSSPPGKPQTAPEESDSNPDPDQEPLAAGQRLQQEERNRDWDQTQSIVTSAAVAETETNSTQAGDATVPDSRSERSPNARSKKKSKASSKKKQKRNNSARKSMKAQSQSENESSDDNESSESESSHSHKRTRGRSKRRHHTRSRSRSRSRSRNAARSPTIEEFESMRATNAAQAENLKTLSQNLQNIEDAIRTGSKAKRLRATSPVRAEDAETQANRKLLNDALIEQSKHGYTASGALKTTKDVAVLLSVNAPLGDDHHMTVRLRGINMKDYLPARMAIEKLVARHGAVWNLIWWLPKPPNTQTSVNLSMGSTDKALKVTQDTDELRRMNFVNADLLSTAIRHRTECMKRIGVPWSAGFIEPHLRGALDTYTDWLVFHSNECPLQTLVAVDTALLDKRKLSEWDFNQQIPQSEYRELLQLAPTDQQKCQFCATNGHTWKQCAAIKGSKDLKQTPTAVQSAVCRNFNISTKFKKLCAGTHVCGLKHACYVCNTSGHPMMFCNKVKQVHDKSYDGYQKPPADKTK